MAQFEYYYKQVKLLVYEKCLPCNDLHASCSPFYNPKNRLIKTFSKGIKNFKKFKKLKDILKIASHGSLPISVIGDIAMADHGEVWSFNYFDNKFDMIASNLKLLDSEVKAISGFVEALEQTTNNQRTTQIIVGCVSFTFISALVAISGYLCRKTTVSQYQRSMNNMLRVVHNMRDEYQSKHNFQEARDDLNNLGQNDVEVEQGNNALREMLSSRTH